VISCAPMTRRQTGLILAVLAAACSKPTSEPPTPTPSASAPPVASVSAPVASAPAPSASAAAAEPPIYPEHRLPEGRLEGGPWTVAFGIARAPGNLGLDQTAAQLQCVAAGKALCTEAQWDRACAADPELGKLETWTCSGVGGQRFIVRGGSAGCAAREVVDVTDLRPTRAAVCCDRAVAITTTNNNRAFMRAASQQLLKYERALRDQNTVALTDIYSDPVAYGGKQYPREQILKRHAADFRAYPKQWVLFDACEVNIGHLGAEVTLDSNCRTSFNRTGKTVVAMQKFVWGGAERRLLQVGDAVTDKAVGAAVQFEGEPEEKERVGVILQSD
jgi:hypothetical protein